MEEQTKEKKYVKYFELFTEYGRLYIYEKYSKDPLNKSNSEVGEVHEFFTGELAIKNYGSLDFLNRSCKFTTYDRDLEGNIRNEYYKELSPYKFLKKVLPYLKNDETIEKKQDEVYTIFKNKIHKVNNYKIVSESPKISKEQKNKEARRILKRYLK